LAVVMTPSITSRRVPLEISVDDLVSSTRMGFTGTYTDLSPDDTTAFTTPKPPAPNATAHAAPIAAHRVRKPDIEPTKPPLWRLILANCRKV
jgi:hypothetical protein